jgi:hypothetical protein
MVPRQEHTSDCEGRAAAQHDLESSQVRVRTVNPVAPLLTLKGTSIVFAVGSSIGVFEIHLDDIGKLGIDKFIGSVIACAFPFSTICLYEWCEAIRNDITLYIQCRSV